MQQHYCYSSECSKLTFMCSSPVWNKVTAIKHLENNQFDSAMTHWQHKTKWQGSACHFNTPRTRRWMGKYTSIMLCFQIMINSFLRPCIQKTWHAGLFWWASISCEWRSLGQEDRQRENEDLMELLRIGQTKINIQATRVFWFYFIAV